MAFGFTTKEMIERLYAQQGLDNILDDVSGPAEDAVLEQFISDAEQTIIIRLSRFHTSADLLTSQWVQSRATWIAAFYISKRRGNEHYFQNLYDEAIREIEAIATGELSPLTEIPLRADTIPSMSNFIIDDYYYARKLRVRQEISVGTSPNADISYVYGWL
jgi:phage gp36-like protein